MKLLPLVLISAVALVDATQTRRLRRSVQAGDVNERYIDLAAEIDESAKDRVARRVQKDDIKAAKRENTERLLAEDSVSLSLSFSLVNRVDLSLSMSMAENLSLSMSI